MAKITPRARQLRYELQLQQGRAVSIQEIATAIGMDRERLNKIELGRIKSISTEELGALCGYYSKALGRHVDTDEILGYDPNNRRVVMQAGAQTIPA